MELFNYSDSFVNFLAKYHQPIYWGCLALSAVITLVAFVFMIVKFRGAFLKIVALILSAAICVALLWVSDMFHNNNINTANNIAKYQQAYENDEVVILSGTIENFASYTNRKEFTLSGVDFVIYEVTEAGSRRDPSETGSILYYTYSGESLVKTQNGYQRVQSDDCVIGENLKLEIHYISEYGQNRILYIKDIGEQ